MRRSKVNIWDNLVCPECGEGFRYENGCRVPDPAFAATFTRRVLCSVRCGELWMLKHPVEKREVLL